MVDSLFETMCEILSDGQRIEIRGFGAFSVKATRPKPAARNPKTGEIIYLYCHPILMPPMRGKP